MRIRLPLIRQKGRPNCGPTSLKMVLSYFGNKISLKDLENEIGYKEGKGTRFQQINKRIFDKARKAIGTDEDILIISNKIRNQNIYKPPIILIIIGSKEIM